MFGGIDRLAARKAHQLRPVFANPAPAGCSRARTACVSSAGLGLKLSHAGHLYRTGIDHGHAADRADQHGNAGRNKEHRRRYNEQIGCQYEELGAGSLRGRSCRRKRLCRHGGAFCHDGHAHGSACGLDRHERKPAADEDHSRVEL